MRNVILLTGLNACPAGYSLVYRRCYMITSSSDRATALSSCQSSGGTLATITSSAENLAVTNFVKSQTTLSVWIGYKRVSGGASFAWEDGSASTYANWNSGEPNNVNEDAVELMSSGYWNDLAGSKSRPGLCSIDMTGKLNLYCFPLHHSPYPTWFYEVSVVGVTRSSMTVQGASNVYSVWGICIV